VTFRLHLPGQANGPIRQEGIAGGVEADVGRAKRAADAPDRQHQRRRVRHQHGQQLARELRREAHVHVDYLVDGRGRRIRQRAECVRHRAVAAHVVDQHRQRARQVARDRAGVVDARLHAVAFGGVRDDGGEFARRICCL